MVQPVTWHPAADRATAETLVVEQDRNVVPLSTWVADAAATAAASDRVLQVLTQAHTRITYPLELLLAEAGAHWVVREGPERFRDGLSGFSLRWSGARFVTDLDAPPPEPVAPAPGSGDLEVQISTLHPASSSLELGSSTGAAIRALTGAEPAGWGVAEPVTQPWSPREVTAHCRQRAPSPTQVVVVGHGVLGQLRVDRVESGVLETIRLSGPAASSVAQDAVDTLVAEIAGTARSMIVAAHPGRLDGLRSPTPAPPALPYGILVGHPVLAERGIDHAQQAPASVRLVGRGTRQAAWCRLDSGGQRPYELLTAVLEHFGIVDASP
ncbi:MAG: hypothetical protein GEV09_04380 [Pseudonocardiaceae bacterium]|nr:hypothetical protein [Pseudonocardiaceae bacterium]